MDEKRGSRGVATLCQVLHCSLRESAPSNDGMVLADWWAMAAVLMVHLQWRGR